MKSDNKQHNTAGDTQDRAPDNTTDMIEESENTLAELPPKDLIKDEKRAEKHFNTYVTKIKKDHPGDSTILSLLQDSMVLRAVAAWPHVERKILLNALDTEDPWDMIWYAPAIWMEAARINKMYQNGVILCVKHNHLVYPDGTIPDVVRMYMLRVGDKLLGIND